MLLSLSNPLPILSSSPATSASFQVVPGQTQAANVRILPMAPKPPSPLPGTGHLLAGSGAASSTVLTALPATLQAQVAKTHNASKTAAPTGSKAVKSSAGESGSTTAPTIAPPSKGSSTSNASVPIIGLEYSPGVASASAMPILVSTPMPSGPSQGPASQLTGTASEDPEQSELTPAGEQRLPALPMASEAQISGILDATQSWMTFRLPVGPTTRSFNITLRQTGPPSGPAIPALDQLYLVNRAGTILTMLKGASAYAEGPLQEMTILLSSVPADAMLLLRIVAVPMQSLPSAGTSSAPVGASSAGSLNVPFAISVQRMDSLATSGTASLNLPLPTALLVGLLTSLGNGYGDVSRASTSLLPSFSSNSADAASGTADPGAGQSLEQQVAATPGRASSQALATTVSVSTGPLISRGSAPLRPLLGTTAEEPTPAIDPHERAFDLAMLTSPSGVDAELLLGLTANHSDGLVTSGRSEASLQSNDPVTFLAGPGGTPVLVCALAGMSSRIDPVAVLATLEPIAAPESGPAPEIQGRGAPEIPIAGAPARGDRPTCEDFLKAACGLMLGLGLTTGPLYPDLVGLIRAVLPGPSALARRLRSRPRRAWRLSHGRSGNGGSLPADWPHGPKSVRRLSHPSVACRSACTCFGGRGARQFLGDELRNGGSASPGPVQERGAVRT